MKTPLREYLDGAGSTAEAFAAAHGMSAWSVRHWARGDKFPNREAQVRMGEATGGVAGPEEWLAWSLAPADRPAEPREEAA